ncbi:allantoate deiminase [Scopulibacillus darangshiensis]|uniref:Allantoate deiminase n=1 Tax=Scopulibacillus darangshiensis TaxID=442528 RepID=A0A4R2NJN4_9BACL|nr:allantoate deiminase [Scopulibacillus darangshiensis]TCP21670.1 allantoate deiminase [Scopulibacillus darangshiensis]
MGNKSDFNIEEEVVEKLKWLGSFGKDPKGGVSRLLYTDEWTQAQESLAQLFKDAGLTVRTDEVGNLFGRLEGTKVKDETILTGSHVDTVKNGGLYDGQYGIIAGFIAIKYLKEKYGEPLRNIEVVSMAEEEGSRFPYSFWGSNNIVGKAKSKDVSGIKDFEGVPFEEAMHKAGFDYKKDPEKVADDLKAFIELHVEQGNVLEKEQIPIGIVQSIVGQKRFTIEINGQANHAGTTPMGYRKDAMNAACRMIHEINDMALAYGDPLVATVGKMILEPNTVNVVPGKAIFTLDIRHTEKAALEKFADDASEKMRKIAEKIDVDIDIDMWMDADPVPMSEKVVEVIQKQCDENKLNYKLMHSGAGHDSQNFAQVVPTAMIFVPSHDGISHNPAEYTEPEDLAEGVKALIGALYKLGYSVEEI